MIQILRPDEAPVSLKKLGGNQTLIDCAAYDARPDDYDSGKAKFSFNRRYYATKVVKDRLFKACNGKCCYCEKKLPRSYLHVEHYRPKSCVRQTTGQKNDDFPGYYWLAYRWDNLLLSCLDCNSTFKHTYFPLADPKKRARSHHMNISEEQPLLLDLASQNPRAHIRFDQEAPTGLTVEGRVTINGLGLRRPELMEDRLSKIDDINARLVILAAAKTHPDDAHLKDKANKALRYIEASRLPQAEFSSMVVDYLAGFGL